MLTPTREAQIRAFAEHDDAPICISELLAEITRLRIAACRHEQGTDAGGNCRTGCGYNADVAYFEGREDPYAGITDVGPQESDLTFAEVDEIRAAGYEPPYRLDPKGKACRRHRPDPRPACHGCAVTQGVAEVRS